MFVVVPVRGWLLLLWLLFCCSSFVLALAFGLVHGLAVFRIGCCRCLASDLSEPEWEREACSKGKGLHRKMAKAVSGALGALPVAVYVLNAVRFEPRLEKAHFGANFPIATP